MADWEKLPELLTPSEVASMFRVDPKTVTRWASSGRLVAIKTPGGHTRYRRDSVREFFRKAEGEQ